MITKIFLFIILIFNPTTNLYAHTSPYFTLISNQNKVEFNINLNDGYKIYWAHVDNSAQATRIDLSESKNLKTYQLIWPAAIAQEHHGIIEHYYTGKLVVPAHIEAIDHKLPVHLKANISYILCRELCVPVTQTIEREFLLTGQEEAKSCCGLLMILGLAVLGGFILNFMPCVLPVLSLKILSITKKPKNPSVSFALTAAGIIVSFMILAAINVFIKNSGGQLGMGLNFQHPEFIIFLSIIITIFISSSLDRINVHLPHKLVQFLGNFKIKNHYFEDFCSGALATILSTPCTAPFLGTAMAAALTGSSNMIFLIFFAVAIGFSSPYLLLISCPSLLRYLPKTGKWTKALKHFLSILLILTLLWLLNILYAQIGWRPTFGLFLLLLLLKFVLENRRKFLKYAISKALIIITIIIASIFLPQIAYQENIEHQKLIDRVWQKFDASKIEHYVREGKIVVVDITASWCVTCKYNKLMVWDRAQTLQLLSRPNVIAMRGDYTNHDPAIYNYLIRSGAYGLPFDKVLGPGGREAPLPVLLSYGDLERAIEEVEKK